MLQGDPCQVPRFETSREVGSCPLAGSLVNEKKKVLTQSFGHDNFVTLGPLIVLLQGLLHHMKVQSTCNTHRLIIQPIRLKCHLVEASGAAGDRVFAWSLQ